MKTNSNPFTQTSKTIISNNTTPTIKIQTNVSNVFSFMTSTLKMNSFLSSMPAKYNATTSKMSSSVAIATQRINSSPMSLPVIQTSKKSYQTNIFNITTATPNIKSSLSSNRFTQPNKISSQSDMKFSTQNIDYSPYSKTKSPSKVFSTQKINTDSTSVLYNPEIKSILTNLHLNFTTDYVNYISANQTV